jgi:aminomethyltransferase
MSMKKLELENIHIGLKAKMMDFAGYNMPVRYTSDKEEHLAVRESVGLFDVSHMGQFFIEGEEALDLIQLISTNDASKLKKGDVQYSCMLNEKGGIVDDLLVYRLDEKSYMLVVNASNIEKDWNHIKKYDTFNCSVTNKSNSYSLFALQGKNAYKILSNLVNEPLDNINMKYYTFKYLNVNRVTEKILISATGYTGAGGYEIYIPNNLSNYIWGEIMVLGEEYNIKPIGLGARDTLRLEKGYCLYGNDINDTTTPHEAGLSWIVKNTKDFIGKDEITKDIKRKLVGFKLVGKGIARSGYDILDSENNIIGNVTSGTMSPSLNEAIGLGYVTIENAKIDSKIYIKIRNKVVEAVVSKYPFI